MTSTRGLLLLVGWCLSTAELRAQFVVVANPYLGTSVPYLVPSGPGLFFGHSGRHSSLALALGSSSVAPAYYYGPAPYGINQVTVLYPPPAAPPAPIIVNVAPRVLRLDDLAMLDPDLRPDPPARPKPPPPDPQLPGGRDAGVFRPLAPDNRDRAARPMPPEKPLPPPRLPEGDLPKPVPPAVDPKAEGERQLKLGREAFAAREYGRATQRFRDMARGAPAEPLPYFLLGQSLFAAGRYPEAVAAIRAGVGLRPDWPNVRFPPRDLYGPNAADFNDHLRRLREALLLLPNDPDLLFLCAYQLWFDGRHDEARPLFQKARQTAADPAVIDRFLAARAAL